MSLARQSAWGLQVAESFENFSQLCGTACWPTLCVGKCAPTGVMARGGFPAAALTIGAGFHPSTVSVRKSPTEYDGTFELGADGKGFKPYVTNQFVKVAASSNH
jgi:hypothetical protein